MAWSFGDSFDLYAAPADMVNGYWDSGNITNFTLVAGRFAGSQCISVQTASGPPSLVKSSGVNDAVHHIAVSFRQTAAITGSTLGVYFELFDGATAQCSIVFRSDGAIVLASGGPTGTVLATYTGAFPTTNTWYAFEFEVTINNTTGVFNVRKNGNTVNDFSATALNTRGGTANNYANKLQYGMNAAVVAHQIDDLFWRSDASSVAWLGDIRCYARMPASDQSVTFSRSLTNFTGSFSGASAITLGNGSPHYTAFTASYDGTLNSVALVANAGWTGNIKCSIFASVGGVPTIILGSAAPINNPITGTNTFTFTPIAVVKGSQYFVGFCTDATSGTINMGAANTGLLSSTAYASFPVASPSTSLSNAVSFTAALTVGTNSTLVNEAQEDGLTSYVYDSNPGDADFYGIGSIASTPATVIATTTRAYMQKSDAGTRTAAVQLKSGATTVASPTLTLSSSGWLWTWRIDLTDPNTGAAWTPAAVNNATVGAKVIA